MVCYWYSNLQFAKHLKTSNSSKETHGAAALRTRITWASFLGSEKPSLALLRSAKLQRTNFSPISNCRRSKSAIFLLSNIKLQYKFIVVVTRRNTYYIYIYISSVKMKITYYNNLIIYIIYNNNIKILGRTLITSVRFSECIGSDFQGDYYYRTVYK